MHLVINNEKKKKKRRVPKYIIIDWAQRSSARPDLALLDLIKLLYSAKVPDETLFPLWISQFEKVLDNRHTVQADSYGNCSSMMTTASAQTLCYLATGGGGVHQPDLTSGGKAGISVGVILFVILTACVGTWLFRRHRRNQRHNFYRMNDLQ